MKIGTTLLAVGLLALPVCTQSEQESRVAQLEEQLARYRRATDKLVGTLTKANQELNVRVKELSKAQGELTIQVAELQVQLDQAHRAGNRRNRGLQDRGRQDRGGSVRPPIPKIGLIYRGDYQVAVERLTAAAEALKQADSVAEGRKLLDGAQKDIEEARSALEKRN